MWIELGIITSILVKEDVQQEGRTASDARIKSTA
jgi:hypothetical protein